MADSEEDRTVNGRQGSAYHSQWQIVKKKVQSMADSEEESTVNGR